MSGHELFNHFNYFKSNLNLGYGMFFRRNFTSVFSLETAYNGTNLKGTPKAAYAVKAFSTGINELDLNSVWNMNNLFSSNFWKMQIN